MTKEQEALTRLRETTVGEYRATIRTPGVAERLVEDLRLLLDALAAANTAYVACREAEQDVRRRLAEAERERDDARAQRDQRHGEAVGMRSVCDDLRAQVARLREALRNQKCHWASKTCGRCLEIDAALTEPAPVGLTGPTYRGDAAILIGGSPPEPAPVGQPAGAARTICDACAEYVDDCTCTRCPHGAREARCPVEDCGHHTTGAPTLTPAQQAAVAEAIAAFDLSECGCNTDDGVSGWICSRCKGRRALAAAFPDLGGQDG